MLPDIKEVEMFKIMECTEVEKHQDRDDLALRHLQGAVPVPFTVARLDLDVFELKVKFLAEIVHNAENFSNFV
jgi:hypothetical protein